MAWSHDSMTADSSVILGAVHVQAGADVAVRLLRHRLPFLVGRGKRNAGFALRRQLTLDFLDKAEDACIQDHFSDLYWLLHDRRGSTHSVPLGTLFWPEEAAAGRAHAPCAAGRVVKKGDRWTRFDRR